MTSVSSLIHQIEQSCADWMGLFRKSFEPNKVKTYTLEHLYNKDVATTSAEVATMQRVHKTLWDESGLVWVGRLPDGWSKHSDSWRTYNVENLEFPGFIFKFCKGAGGRGVPAAHFLRVPKGQEIKQVIKDEGLDELELVEERLIALKPQQELQKMNEAEQCCHFVVASRKLNLMSEFETIDALAAMPVQRQVKIATQIARLICRTGLGDVGFHNIHINKETGKPVIVDTEPVFGSLLLDEPPEFSHQYPHTQTLLRSCTNSATILAGLNSMIRPSLQQKLPIFQQVAEIYKKHIN